jgi:DNA-binding response OmpR family regulator
MKSDPGESTQVIILDDDPAFCNAMKAYLEINGCQVDTVHEANVFFQMLQVKTPDILLLDQRLDMMSGTDVLKTVRQKYDFPCIIITGNSDPMDRIVNLELGADDECEKNTSPREILARIRAVVRRNRIAAAPAPVAATSNAGEWRFQVARRELRRPNGAICPLTTAEFAMLRVLYESVGEPVSRAVLFESVFGRRYDPMDRAVDTLIRKLRAKLEPGSEPTVIKTIRPIGYAFMGFPEQDSLPEAEGG